MLSFSATIILLEWLIRVIMVPVVVMRKSRPVTCLAWLTLISLLPFVGLAVYWTVGENRLGKNRSRRYSSHAFNLMTTVRRSAELSRGIITPPLTDDQRMIAQTIAAGGGMPILGGNQADLIVDSQQMLDRLVADIDAATHQVHLLFYIYHPDSHGRQVAAALERAALRGVKCRLLVDAVGARLLFHSLGQHMIRHGVDIIAFLPANPIRRNFARLDLRNHRKLAVIDGRIAYTGSQNIAEPHYGTRFGPWRDMMVRITGPSVAQLQAVFVEDWNFATHGTLDEADLFPTIEPLGQVAIQAIPSGPNYPTEVLSDIMVEAVHSARRSVIITTPYLIPDDSLLAALRLGVLRGAHVSVVVPRATNHPLVDLAGRFYIGELLKYGVHVFLHSEGILHAKTLTVDDWLAMVGSANFDIRSFHLNFELNVLLYNPQLVKQVRVSQMQYIREAVEMTAESWAKRPPAARLAQNLAKLLSPLL